MAEQSKIEWTDHTFNPWEGCQKVAPECDNCYAENRDMRFTGGVHWGPKAPRRRTSAQNWNKPRRWNKQAEAFHAAHGRRQRVFCASLADVFDNAVDPKWREDLWALVRECDQLDWLLLTKRPQNLAKMLPPDWEGGWPHVWLGTSAGTQKTANQNIPHLLAAPAAVRFVSAEPMLGPVRLDYIATSETEWIDALDGIECRDTTGCADLEPAGETARIHWVICGGESGPKARPTHPDWARDLRDQCCAAGTAFFFKQWGEWAPGAIAGPNDRAVDAATWWNQVWNYERIGKAQPDQHFDDEPDVFRVGKKAAGRLLDGREWNEVPRGPMEGGI